MGFLLMTATSRDQSCTYRVRCRVSHTKVHSGCLVQKGQSTRHPTWRHRIICYVSHFTITTCRIAKPRLLNFPTSSSQVSHISAWVSHPSRTLREWCLCMMLMKDSRLSYIGLRRVDSNRVLVIACSLFDRCGCCHHNCA
jgi:hypothetical protein